jgi:hypothetical protein
VGAAAAWRGLMKAHLPGSRRRPPPRRPVGVGDHRLTRRKRRRPWLQDGAGRAPSACSTRASAVALVRPPAQANIDALHHHVPVEERLRSWREGDEAAAGLPLGAPWDVEEAKPAGWTADAAGLTNGALGHGRAAAPRDRPPLPGPGRRRAGLCPCTEAARASSLSSWPPSSSRRAACRLPASARAGRTWPGRGSLPAGKVGAGRGSTAPHFQ